MRGYIRRRGQGSWEVTVELGRDPITGKRQRHTQNIRGSKRDAEKAQNAAISALNGGTYVKSANTTVAAYLRGWLRDVEKRVSARTHERYEEIAENHLVPALGRLVLSDLRPHHIAAAERDWSTVGRKSGPGGLAPRTVVHHHRVLHQALQHAVRLQLIPINPASAVAPPRPPRTEMRSLSPEQAITLLDALSATEFEGPIATLLLTGLRVGELRALQWKDVEFRNDAGTERCTLKIQRSLQPRQGGGEVFQATKTHRSTRRIDVPSATMRLLRDQRAAQLKHRISLGESWNDMDLVFTDALGKPMSHARLRTALKKTLAATGLPDLRLHDLRHSMATLMLSQGINVKVVSEMLGHASIQITLDTYHHVLPGLQQDAAEQLWASLVAARGVR